MRVIIILVAALLAYFGWQWFRKGYAEHGRPFAIKALLIAIAVILVGLAMFGRVHWIGAAAATLVAGLRFVLPMLLRHLPLILNLRQAQAQAKTQQQPPPGGSAANLDLDENAALAILGLEKPYTKEDVVKAHKRMIQNLHPDKGGSDFLAAQVNAAKTVLLDILEKS